ncbi:MAG: hypothetical protein ACKVOE_01470 [Rickettsiales bacterium]
MIFEDEATQLVKFRQTYEAMGFDVIPVLVAQHCDDKYVKDGHINADAVRHDTINMPEDSTSNLLDMREIDLAVRSKSEVRELLATIKPDYVLSDLAMRMPLNREAPEEDNIADDDVVRGTDVMAIVKELAPKTPRAIHTTDFNGLLYANVPNNPERQAAMRESGQNKLRAAQELGRREGYLIMPKDRDDHTSTEAIAEHFRSQQEKIVPLM